MKKILALVLSLVFALSVCTVAFAAEADLTCDTCKAKLADAKAYAAHVNGGCLVDFKDCQYCGAKVATDNLATHEGSCPKGAEACDWCGKMQDCQDCLAEHKDAKACEKACADCGAKVKLADKDTHECAIEDQIANTVANIDWEEVLNKVIEFVSSIDFDALIAEVEGIIAEVEVLLADIDFDGIIADVKGAFEGLAA